MMKRLKFIVLLLLLLIVYGMIESQVLGSTVAITPHYTFTVSGALIHDETWFGTVHVTGDIYIPKGVTLTIEPGTIIYMAANSDDQHSGGEHVKDELTWDPETGTWIDPSATKEYTRSHISWQIDGTIKAIGTPNKIIVFTSDSNLPTHLDWDHFVIGPEGSGILRYCIFEWIHAGPALQTSSATISHCIVRHTFWGGIHAYYASPVIENNLIEDIGHEGIDILRSSAIIRGNMIKKARSGIVTRYAGYDGAPLIIEHNILINAKPIHLQVYSNAIIRNNILVRGDPREDGGLWTYQGYTLTASREGPAILLMDYARAIIVNNAIDGFFGHGIQYLPISETFAIHEDIHGVNAISPEYIEIKNNIITNCTQTAVRAEDQFHNLSWKNITISFNCFWNNRDRSLDEYIPAGVSNILTDPMFVEPANIDYHLKQYSPCIDAGDPSILDNDGSHSDMGAYGGPAGRWEIRKSCSIKFDFETSTEGWIPATEDPNNPFGNGAIDGVAQLADRAYTGAYSLKISVDLQPGEDSPKRNGEALVMYTGNLEGHQITARVWCPTGSMGNPHAPNGIMLFVKDSKWESEYGSWKDIQENTWIELSLVVDGYSDLPYGWASPEFDPTDVIAIGFKIGANTAHRAKGYNGPIYLDTMCFDITPWTVPESDYKFDFENMTCELQKEKPFDEHRPYWDIDEGWNATAWRSEDINI